MTEETRWLTDAEARAWRGYRRMRVLLDLRLSRDLANDSGLSDADYDVLSNLSETADHRMRLTDLAAHLHWSKSRLSHHLTRMGHRGLIERTGFPGDARGAVVVLTAQGWATIRAAAPPHVESVRRNLIDLLSPEQIRMLGDLCATVVRHLSDEPAADAGVAGRS